jgi:hypothetical protein
VSDLRQEIENALREESVQLNLSPTPRIAASRQLLRPGDSTLVTIGSGRRDERIRYAIVDSSHAMQWRNYDNQPITLKDERTIVAISRLPGLAESLPVTRHIYSVGEGNGMKVALYDTALASLRSWKSEGVRPAWEGTCFSFDLGEFEHRQDNYVVLYEGDLSVQREGDFEISLSSDDGSRLWVDGNLCVDNDGYHGMLEKRNTLKLAAGYHSMKVEFFQAGGAAGLELRLGRVGEVLKPIPPSAVFLPGRAR